MPPDSRPIPRFAAEPPHDSFPYGRWAERLRERFVEACAEQIDPGDAIGDPRDITWFPERTFEGRTYIPATAPTSEGFEVFGFVSFVREPDVEELEFWSRVEYTDETAEANPDWKLDLSDYEIGEWRGPETLSAKIALVWGMALVRGGAVATAELGPTTSDQCEVVDARFTLVSLEEWTGDLLEVRLYDAKGGQLASESLYEEE
jgi:hypothetical protein